MNLGTERPEESRRPGGTLVREASEKTFELNLETILRLSKLTVDQINPITFDTYTNKRFVASIPDSIKSDPELLGEFLKNSIVFSNHIHTKEFLGDYISVPESLHGDGRARRAESGAEILIEKIKALGIDPYRVLYFRRTQPTEKTANPELYWTSSYFETLTGLTAEISGEKRKTSVILCSTLGDISSDSRLIADINDDTGLPVRRESMAPYDQKRVLFTIQNN